MSLSSRYRPTIDEIAPLSHSRSGSLSSQRTPASPHDPLSAALSTAQARYTISNAKSLAAHNAACRDLPGGNTRTVLYTTPFPLTFVKGKGCELTSLDGDVYVDFLGEYSAGLFGHSNVEIAAAIATAMEHGWNFGGPNVFEKDLARKVTDRFSGSGVELVRFTNSGTEANSMAIAAAVTFTGRKKILVFRGGYHGGRLAFPSNLNDINTNLPQEFVIAPYNDLSATQAIVKSLPKESLAAVLVESVQGNGGCIPGSSTFLRGINKLAHQEGALFIVDEVMTSRLSYHGLSSLLGLKPDLVTMGKWIGGGMTFGAFGGRKEAGVMNMFDPRTGVLAHSGTFNNNVITMAAGCAGMDIYTEAAVARLNSLGDSLRKGVGTVLTTHGIAKPVEEPPQDPIGLQSLSLADKNDSRGLMWISGYGSLLNIHFSGDQEKSMRALFWHHMLDRGIYLAQRGFIALNIELNETHVEKFVQAVDAFVAKYRLALTS